LEDGKFGDQKYLDDWTTRFSGVHVLQNLGGGVAPWNVQQYDLSELDLVFYHFHGVKIFKNDQLDFASYELPKLVVERIYSPYIKHLCLIADKFGLDSSFHGVVEAPNGVKFALRSIRRWLKGVYNVYPVRKFCE
jgi:hypothetical protein